MTGPYRIDSILQARTEGLAESIFANAVARYIAKAIASGANVQAGRLPEFAEIARVAAAKFYESNPVFPKDIATGQRSA